MDYIEQAIFGERLRETFAPPEDDEFARLLVMLDKVEFEMEADQPDAR